MLSGCFAITVGKFCHNGFLNPTSFLSPTFNRPSDIVRRGSEKSIRVRPTMKTAVGAVIVFAAMTGSDAVCGQTVGVTGGQVRGPMLDKSGAVFRAYRLAQRSDSIGT